MTSLNSNPQRFFTFSIIITAKKILLIFCVNSSFNSFILSIVDQLIKYKITSIIMSAKRARTTDDKEIIDKSDINKMSTLYKHMNGWYSDHPGEAFISPRDFQNAYPQWDKYLSDSFRKVFIPLRVKFQRVSFSCHLFLPLLWSTIVILTCFMLYREWKVRMGQ